MDWRLISRVGPSSNNENPSGSFCSGSLMMKVFWQWLQRTSLPIYLRRTLNVVSQLGHAMTIRSSDCADWIDGPAVAVSNPGAIGSFIGMARNT